MYKLGFSKEEVSEEALKKSGFEYEKCIVGEKVLSVLLSVIGKPYKYGASVSKDAPDAFDCSSLTAYAYVQAGVSIPRMAVDQFVFCVPVKELEAGDLVFANTGESKRKTDYQSIEYMSGTSVPFGVDHVGVYVGDGEIIHATGLFGKVVREKLSEAERFKNIVGYGRACDLEEERFVISVTSMELRDREKLLGEIKKYE